MPTLRKYEYRRRLPHLQRDGAVFVTFDTFHRLVLSPEERDIVMECCRIADGKTIELHAIVVMPDHVHMLFTPVGDETGECYSLPEIMQPIKGASSHRINRMRGTKGAVWQAESFDHVPRSHASFAGVIEYISFNPISANLAERPSDYRWLWLQD